MSEDLEQVIIESKLKYMAPTQATNVALEIINSFKGHNSSRVLIQDASSDGREFSGSELWQLTGRLATGLMKSPLQVQPGERLLLMCEHNLREHLLMLATLYTGAASLGTWRESCVNILAYCEQLKPEVIMCTNDQLELALRLRRQVSGMCNTRIVLIDDDELKSNELIEERHEKDLFLGQLLFEWPQLDENLIMQRVGDIEASRAHCLFLVTSGSTGKSNVVPWTHHATLANIWMIISATKRPVRQGNRPLLPIEGNDFVLAGDLPLDQGTSLFKMLWSFIVGGKYVLMRPYDEEQFWGDVAKYKITCSIGSSTFQYRLVRKLVQWFDEGESIDISSMTYMTGSGAPVKLGPLLNKLRPVHPKLNVTQLYAASEMGKVCILSSEDARFSLEPVGHLMPGVKVKVVDSNTSRCVGPGEEGELLVMSPALFEAYIPHPQERLVDVMRDRKDEQGFYRTGDLVHYDDEQRFYIHGRLKDTLYLEFDWKLMPSEIEEVINGHPLVESSVVVGLPNGDVEGCVIPKAFIKLKGSKELAHIEKTKDELQLIELLAANNRLAIVANIAKYLDIHLVDVARPRAGISIVDSFPTLGSLQKIDRRKLARMAVQSDSGLRTSRNCQLPNGWL